MFSAPELSSASLLIFANKQDLKQALPAEQIARELRIEALKNRNCIVQPCCGATGEGLYQGLGSLMRAMSQKSVS